MSGRTEKNRENPRKSDHDGQSFGGSENGSYRVGSRNVTSTTAKFDLEKRSLLLREGSSAPSAGTES
jgi:hypothetical protein